MMNTTTKMMLAAVGLAFAASACADASDAGDAEGVEVLEQTAAGDLPPLPDFAGTATTVPNPSGLYVASIRASGSGCPNKDSYEAHISDDGLAFTVFFDQYEIYAEADKPIAQTKNCALAIEMSSPAGRSFGVQSMHYQGYAKLEPGMTAQQIAYYTFAGSSITSSANVQGLGVRAARHNLSGPHDESYLFSDNVDLKDVNYSDCAAKSATLFVNSTLVLNNPRRQGGYINNSSVDGETKTKLVINLAERKCPAS